MIRADVEVYYIIILIIYVILLLGISGGKTRQVACLYRLHRQRRKANRFFHWFCDLCVYLDASL